jgi:hypothetical protein
MDIQYMFMYAYIPIHFIMLLSTELLEVKVQMPVGSELVSMIH